MSLSQAILGAFQHESANTRKVLAIVPEDKFDWKPHEKSMSLGQLVSHIAENPSWVHSMLEDELDFEAGMADYKPFAAADQAELLETFDNNVAAFEQALADKDDDFMTANWTARKGDAILMQGPRHAAIHSFNVNHSIHHRGQLTVYLRMLDIPLPPLYGPTADDPSFG